MYEHPEVLNIMKFKRLKWCGNDDRMDAGRQKMCRLILLNKVGMGEEDEKTRNRANRFVCCGVEWYQWK